MSKVQNLPALSDSQLEIMQVVWESDDVTVGEVWRRLSHEREVARNTVLTLMERLVKKGWLKRRTEGNAHRYTAIPTRRATLKHVVKRLVDTAFSGAADELVMALLDGRGVSKDEADRIRKLIEQAKGKKQ